ncbi:PA3371 family protein [Pseudomonas syringae]|uniref:PA3371 family protein n=1 Tax=Pseudomonas syringae TaxID=317 RepID=UPI0004221D23|nr:PA3371 family protein [Pseudomonas syringae]
MSKSALSFLVLAVMAVVVDLLLPLHAPAMSIAANIAAGVFASLFVVALFFGRRFKFDPVLR